MDPASSGGKSRARQSALIPIPTTTRGSSRPEALALAQDARELAQVDGRGEAGRGRLRVELADEQGVRARDLDHEVVRPLEPDGADGQAGGVLGGVGHRQRDRRGQAPGPVGRRATSGRKPSEARRAASGGADHVRPWRPRPAVCSSATARQISGTPSASQPRTTSFVDPMRREPLDAGEHGGRGGGPGHDLSRRPRRPPRRSRAAPARTRRGGRGRPPPPGPRR